MEKFKQKNIKLSPTGRALLAACKGKSGFTDTEIMENCLALQALTLGVECERAREFLYQNLVARVAVAPVHQAHPLPQPRLEGAAKRPPKSKVLHEC